MNLWKNIFVGWTDLALVVLDRYSFCRTAGNETLSVWHSPTYPKPLPQCTKELQLVQECPLDPCQPGCSCCITTELWQLCDLLSVHLAALWEAAITPVTEIYLTTIFERCSSPAASACFNTGANVPSCSGGWRHSGSPDETFYALKLEGWASLQFLNLMHGAAFSFFLSSSDPGGTWGWNFPLCLSCTQALYPHWSSGANPSTLTSS